MGSASGPFDYIAQLVVDLTKATDEQWKQIWNVLHPGETAPPKPQGKE